MPLRPRHTPSLNSGAELCPQPEINPVPMVIYSLLTHILEFWMWIRQKITISGGAILKKKTTYVAGTLGNFVNHFHTWAESFNNKPWTIATNKFELDLRCFVANLIFNACHALFGAWFQKNLCSAQTVSKYSGFRLLVFFTPGGRSQNFLAVSIICRLMLPFCEFCFPQHNPRSMKIVQQVSIILISVHSRNMSAQSISGLECLFAMVTIVAEVPREVYTFNMVPGMDLLREALQKRIFVDFIWRGKGSCGIRSSGI